MPKMIFVQRDGTRLEVDAPLGLSVLEIAHRNDIDIEGACEGSLACSTCHVIVDPEWYELLSTGKELAPWDDAGRLWKFGQATMYLIPDVPAVIIGSQFVYDLAR